MDISKRVITQELQFYLGPNATVRPYTREVRDPVMRVLILMARQGVDGFLITTQGDCLTDVSSQ